MFSGGAGGKGVWGKLGSEILEEDMDRNDPNYDSDTFDSGNTELAAIIPEATDQEIRVIVFDSICYFFIFVVVFILSIRNNFFYLS